MATDFPEPVVPATSKCGIFAKSATTAPPEISLPIIIGKAYFEFWYASLSSISLIKIVSLCLLGNSIPIAFLLGITEILAETADIDLAISSASPITLEDLVPADGSNSWSVIIGPTFASSIVPLIPKSFKTSKSFDDWAINSVFEIEFFALLSFFFNNSIVGKI